MTLDELVYQLGYIEGLVIGTQLALTVLVVPVLTLAAVTRRWFA